MNRCQASGKLRTRQGLMNNGGCLHPNSKKFTLRRRLQVERFAKQISCISKATVQGRVSDQSIPSQVELCALVTVIYQTEYVPRQRRTENLARRHGRPIMTFRLLHTGPTPKRPSFKGSTKCFPVRTLCDGPLHVD